MTSTSTPTRSPRPAGVARLAAMRAAFGVLDTVAPHVSARWALRLWSTLPSNGGRRRDERPFAGERSVVDLPGRRSVVVETWGVGEPVYLVHGWGGWRGQLGAFVAPIVDAGRRVVAFDAPSHGESGPGVLGPRRSTAVEMTEALLAVVERHGEPAAVVGHSLGCTTTAIAVHDGMPAARVALVAPSADVVAMTDEMARRLGYAERTKREFASRLETLAGRPLTDFDLTRMAGAVPALVVHDRLDKEVPYAEGVRVSQAWPAATLETTEGLGHQRILRDPGVIARVVEFVAPSRPSRGAVAAQ
ncbi:alpha/beta hydrolase family protein [Georgenia soli]|uniref:Alpha/beta hydrolase family protein n=1 Tax=Georgenia soli TaxID=638953 RepID=A0A2A9ELS8_9MICO|nr:alpha/beta fold hydrolase [Georgenia soli]PFG39868.1 alpha/beta hydrolase family protein [Georgenia soli]